ncbi:MAG: hypothetical protein DCF31_01860 [Alphaproteobacteria bacterium]|nr:MAG: hypothetical protein DCF31_01860 [Alphaproteobacteria bacterium]
MQPSPRPAFPIVSTDRGDRRSVARRLRLPAIAAAVALAACNQPAPDTTQSATATTQTTTVAPAAAPTAVLWNNGQSRPLDVQVAHANGTVLQLTSLQSRDTATAVGVRVINGHRRDVDLNRFPNNRNGFLLLETGERLYLSPPAVNPRLTVPIDQTFEGELVFLGRLPPVKAAVLVLNDSMSGDGEHTAAPGFRIDLPLTAAAQPAAPAR